MESTDQNRIRLGIPMTQQRWRDTRGMHCPHCRNTFLQHRIAVEPLSTEKVSIRHTCKFCQKATQLLYRVKAHWEAIQCGHCETPDFGISFDWDQNGGKLVAECAEHNQTVISRATPIQWREVGA